MQSWQAALAVFATLLIAMSSCDSISDCGDALECSYYYDLLEKALLNDSSNVYGLQQAFFPLNKELPIVLDFWVNISIVGETLDTSCSDVGLSFSDGQYFYQWTPSISTLRKGIYAESFFIAEPIYGYRFVSSGLYDYQHPSKVDIDLKLERLPCNPRRDTCTTDCTLARLITLAKSYARARGRPGKLDESDRGKVIKIDRNSIIILFGYYDKVIDRLLLAGFVFLYVLVMLLMVRFIPGHYHTFVRRVNSEVNSVYLSFYWGCALVLFFLAMDLCLFDLGLYMIFLFSGVGNVLYLATCISIKFVVMVVELIVCAFVCKRNTITVHIPFQWCITNVIFCCCCCCCCSSIQKSKVVQTLALWGIMVFVQHITASLVPVSFDIITQPEEALSILALVASTLFCTIILVAHLLHLGSVTGYQESAAFCVQILATALFIGLAIVLNVLYFMLLESGYELSFSSFLGSLIPSVIISGGGWYIKRKLLDTKDPKSTQLTQPTAPNPTTKPDQGGVTNDGVLETVVVHRNAPESESDGKRTPLLWNMN